MGIWVYNIDMKKWKAKPNLAVTLILTLVFVIATLLNILGPLHTDASGQISPPTDLSIYSLLYLIVSLLIIWGLYFSLYKKPKLLFYILITVGMLIIILENFLWAWIGSQNVVY